MTGEVYWATGRRKEAAARVGLKSGDGKFIVNGKPLSDYLCRETLVMVVGSDANDALYHQMNAGDGPDCQLIGDAMSPRRVNDAIREGEMAARRL